MKLLQPIRTKTSAPPPLWYVSNGDQTVGPVRTNLLLRGVGHGRVPTSSVVRELHWSGWRPVEQIREVRALRRQQARWGWDWKPTPDFKLPDVREEARASTLEAVQLARDPNEVLLYGLQTAMAQIGCDVGLIHRHRAPFIGMVTSYAQGPGMADQLGKVVSRQDPCFQAACSQRGVIGRLLHGEGQRAVARRLEAQSNALKGVVMLPIVGHDRLLGMLELGRTDRQFRSADKSLLEGIGLGIRDRVDGTNWA